MMIDSGYDRYGLELADHFDEARHRQLEHAAPELGRGGCGVSANAFS
jgi:hypothetical protein